MMKYKRAITHSSIFSQCKNNTKHSTIYETIHWWGELFYWWETRPLMSSTFTWL